MDKLKKLYFTYWRNFWCWISVLYLFCTSQVIFRVKHFVQFNVIETIHTTKCCSIFVIRLKMNIYVCEVEMFSGTFILWDAVCSQVIKIKWNIESLSWKNICHDIKHFFLVDEGKFLNCNHTFTRMLQKIIFSRNIWTYYIIKRGTRYFDILVIDKLDINNYFVFFSLWAFKIIVISIFTMDSEYAPPCGSFGEFIIICDVFTSYDDR